MDKTIEVDHSQKNDGLNLTATISSMSEIEKRIAQATSAAAQTCANQVLTALAPYLASKFELDVENVSLALNEFTIDGTKAKGGACTHTVAGKNPKPCPKTGTVKIDGEWRCELHATTAMNQKKKEPSAKVVAKEAEKKKKTIEDADEEPKEDPAPKKKAPAKKAKKDEDAEEEPKEEPAPKKKAAPKKEKESKTKAKKETEAVVEETEETPKEKAKAKPAKAAPKKADPKVKTETASKIIAAVKGKASAIKNKLVAEQVGDLHVLKGDHRLILTAADSGTVFAKLDEEGNTVELDDDDKAFAEKHNLTVTEATPEEGETPEEPVDDVPLDEEATEEPGDE
jgi:hypothetical protein